MSLYESDLGSLQTYYSFVAWSSCETLNYRISGCLTLLPAFEDLFSSIRLSCPAWIWQYMPSILVTCIPYLVNIPRSPVLFLREKEEELIWVRRTGRAVRGSCSQDKISERRILLKSKLPYIKNWNTLLEWYNVSDIWNSQSQQDAK